jgi:hypothetical protein
LPPSLLFYFIWGRGENFNLRATENTFLSLA